MDGFLTSMITGVVIVAAAFGVLILVKTRMKKDAGELNKPAEVVEMEMQELIAKAKADMEKNGTEPTDQSETAGPTLSEEEEK